MNVDIVFPSPQWELLQRHLFEAAPDPGGHGSDEQLAFALAAPVQSPTGVRLTIREVVPARPQDLEHRSPVAIAPTAEFVAAALSRCRQEGWSLVEVHSHPFSHGPGTTFSGVDWSSDRAKMPRVAELLPEHTLHATMVLGRSSLDAHYYDRGSASIRPIHRIRVLGVQAGTPQLMRITPTGAANPPGPARRRLWGRRSGNPDATAEDDRYSRQLPLLGKKTQELLAETTVAVVGLGGWAPSPPSNARTSDSAGSSSSTRTRSNAPTSTGCSARRRRMSGVPRSRCTPTWCAPSRRRAPSQPWQAR